MIIQAQALCYCFTDCVSISQILERLVLLKKSLDAEGIELETELTLLISLPPRPVFPFII